MRSHDAYWQQVLQAMKDRGLREALPFIDWSRVLADPRSLLEQPSGAAFRISMLTYYRFLTAVNADHV